MKFTALSWQKLSIIAVLAAIIYDSWPLGYLLNAPAAAHGLASELEAVGQPYNWVFIGGDVLSSLLIIGVVYCLWMRTEATPQRRWLQFSLVNMIIFAVGTILDALLPERCSPTLQVCPNFTQDHLLLVHGIFSIVASFCLFLSLLSVWWHHRMSAVLNAMMVGYILFGIFSLVSAIRPTPNNWAQHYSLTLTSAWIALLPYCIEQVVHQRRSWYR